MIDRQKLLKRIKAARLAIGYTQGDAAESLNCTRQCWCQWENGTKAASVDTIAAMAAAVGLEMEIELKKKKRS